MTPELSKDVIDIAFDRWTMLISGAIFLFLRMLGSIPGLSANRIYKRALPLLPAVLGIAAAFLDGIPAVTDQVAVIKISAGVWCAAVSATFHKFLGQTVLGDDSAMRLPKPEKSLTVQGEETDRKLIAPEVSDVSRPGGHGE